MRTLYALAFLAAMAGQILQGANVKDKKKVAPKPEIQVAEKFRNQGENAAPLKEAWWRGFNDPLLNELMDRGATANLDVRTAALRVSEARAAAGVSRSALLPSIDGSSNITRLRGGFNEGIIRVPQGAVAGGGSFVSPFETGLVSGGTTARWELDLFGANRKSFNAAKADALAAEESMEDARVLVRSEIARNYVEMRGYEAQMEVVKKNIETERELLDLVRVRAEAGLATDLDVERQLAQLYTFTALLPDLDASRLTAAHRISVLLGEQPTVLLDRLERERTALLTPAVPMAVPSDLLKRRRDVRQAEFAIAAAFQRVGAAKADLYPKFVISGLIGRQATGFSGLTLGGGNFFSLGPQITMPFFNAGRIRSNIAVQDARLQQSVRAYESEVLAAMEETENAFVARDRAELKKREVESGLKAAQRSLELARELYVRGLGDFLAVLDAQRQVLSLEREVAATETAVLRGTVQLYKALAL